MKKSDKSDTGHFNPDNSNDHTFGRRSKLSSKAAEIEEDSQEELDRADIGTKEITVNQ